MYKIESIFLNRTVFCVVINKDLLLCVGADLENAEQQL
jgi:hypothetical protein